MAFRHKNYARRVVAGTVALAAGVAVSLASVSPATADPLGWVPFSSGLTLVRHTTNNGGQDHFAFAAWNPYNAQDPDGQDVYELDMTTGILPSDRCMDAVFDWHTAGGHFDARIVRVCPDNAYRTNGVNKEWQAPNAAFLVGAQRYGICLYVWSTNNRALPGGSAPCSDDPDMTIPASGTPARFWDCSVRMWWRAPNGTTNYFDGGDQRSPTC